jgi:polyisoprenoid-binding protein YceI
MNSNNLNHMRTFFFTIILLAILIAGVAWWYQSGVAIDTARVSDTDVATTTNADVATSTPSATVPETGAPLEERIAPVSGVYTIHTAESMVGWAGQKPLIDGYVNSGTIAIQEGSVRIGSDNSVSGGFVLDMHSITVGLTATKPGAEGALQEHLKGDAFFRVEEYPTAEFVVTQSERLNDFSYRITGNLTMLGNTEEVVFDAETFATDGGAVLTVLAQFAIDRTRWGLTVGSGSFFENLGDRLIADEVLLDVLVVANRTSQ